MAELPPIVRTVADLRTFVRTQRNNGKKVGLVPTMGALHHGHLSLVDEIARHVDVPIVSIFVNPTQFGEGEDFETYPRDEQTDLEKLSKTKAALVFAPLVSEMYPAGDSTRVSVSGITERFEGAQRPGHFEGVATVVSKLLLQCLPDVAIFGEKDYQQLAVIRRFVRDLCLPVSIIGGPIIREADGLAASSRNTYLSDNGRKIASQFNKVLSDLVRSIEGGTRVSDAENTAAHHLMEAGFDKVDYISIVHPETLEPLTAVDGKARVLAVARLEGVRLLDNIAINCG